MTKTFSFSFYVSFSIYPYSRTNLLNTRLRSLEVVLKVLARGVEKLLMVPVNASEKEKRDIEGKQSSVAEQHEIYTHLERVRSRLCWTWL